MITIQLSDEGMTVGDFTTAQGAIFKAAAEFVDWERLHEGQADAVGAPALILLVIAKELTV